MAPAATTPDASDSANAARTWPAVRVGRWMTAAEITPWVATRPRLMMTSVAVTTPKSAGVSRRPSTASRASWEIPCAA